MDWVKLVIPLIALGVWILSHILSAQQNPPQRRLGPRPTPRTREGNDEGDRSEEDFQKEQARIELDRRIAEARRRRQLREEPEEAKEFSATRVPPPLPMPAQRKPIPPAAGKPVATPPRPTSSPVPIPRPDAIPTVVPEVRLPGAALPKAALPKAALPKISLPGIEVPKAVPTTPAVAEALVYMDQQQDMGKSNHVAVRLKELLRDRDSLAAAFLLKEIFDRPADRRRRKR